MRVPDAIGADAETVIGLSQFVTINVTEEIDQSVRFFKRAFISARQSEKVTL
jgi:hypothetical protein